MKSISQTQRYYPHEIITKYYAVKLYRQGYSVAFVCRRYKISKSSLLRWNKCFDGTKESLEDKSHKPISKHPNSHTEEELKWINDYIKRNPTISMTELYGKLRINRGYSRHACSLFRLLRRIGYFEDKRKKHVKYKPKKYNTPINIAEKWQLDVKYVPSECNVNKSDDNRYYQYTVVDEASRERFIYPYREQSSYSTIDFIKRSIIYFGYKPNIIQTDNGFEFTYGTKTDKIHPFDTFCNVLKITHKLIRPRTPRHNGKVERSHRNDNERFYKFLSFYSYEDLKLQMKQYLKRSNNIPMQTLDWMTPIEKRKQLKK